MELKPLKYKCQLFELYLYMKYCICYEIYRALVPVKCSCGTEKGCRL